MKNFTLYYWYNKYQKEIPSSVSRKIFYSSLFIILVMIIFSLIESNTINKTFYKLDLSDKVENIILEENGFHFKIGKNWYLLKHPIVKYLSIGDSILKKPNSLYVIVKDSNNVVKWESEVRKNIYFSKD